MIVKMLTLGPLYTNCYIVTCSETKEALIIDPGFEEKKDAEKVLKEVKQQGLHVKYIVNTHGHPDHIGGNRIIKEATNALILIHEYDAPMLTDVARELPMSFGLQMMSPPADKTIHEGDLIQAGKTTLRVLHTPGHSKGSISLLGNNIIFTGDTLFAGSIGRYDLPGASYKEIIHSIKRLATLPEHVKAYPGHGPTTTIGKEKNSNPFLQMSI
ncbi:MAG: MBL fold metallo-hydrolase [Candidatus Bathyarchaeota archaeon]|nr:MBL fold metallo-hydrolase [Candidatus Bathyarchaeota archaeon]